MPIRIRRFPTLLVLFLVLAAPAEARPGGKAHGAPAEVMGRARVVLVGDVAKSDELKAVLAELLERRRVVVEFEEQERFRSSALLSEAASDSRVWVFVARSEKNTAKLYFRGPDGERFLLRTLNLKSGLDELGRELIAQVVETSTVALLRAEAGVTREEVRADLSAEDASLGVDSSPPPPTSVAPTEKEGAADETARASGHGDGRFELDVAARGIAKWTGSDLGLDHGVGAEAAVAGRFASGFALRGRLVVEYGLGQSIDTNGVFGTVQTTALRAMADARFAMGPSGLALGLGGGVDRVDLEPRVAVGSSLTAAPGTLTTVPILRIEARYELTLGVFCMSAGVLADVSLMDTHYDVRDGTGTRRIAEPWPVRPGMAAALGVCPRF